MESYFYVFPLYLTLTSNIDNDTFKTFLNIGRRIMVNQALFWGTAGIS